MKQRNFNATNSILKFICVYSWAILGALMCMGILGYFVIYRSQSNYVCLSQKFCESQNLNFYYSSAINNKIYCERYIMQNISWIIEIKVYSFSILEQMFPNCS